MQNEKGCTTAYVYGQDDVRKKNPSTIQQPLISESFARHGIYQSILNTMKTLPYHIFHKEDKINILVVFIYLWQHLGLVMIIY